MNRIISSNSGVCANGVRTSRTRGIFRAVLSAMAVASLVFAIGCSDDDDDNGGGGGVAGGGSIVNGATEAWLESECADKDCGGVSFRPDGQAWMVENNGDECEYESMGTYTISGNTVVVSNGLSATFSVTNNGNTLTLNLPPVMGGTQTFTRRSGFTFVPGTV